MAKAKDSQVSTKERSAVISDDGQVRIGSSSPAFPPARGGPANTSDTAKVRIGNSSPAFPMMPPLVRGRPVIMSESGEARVREFSPADSSARVPSEPNVRIAAVSQTFVRSR